MKKLVIASILCGIELWGGCLIKLNPTKYGFLSFGGEKGIDSIAVKNKMVFSSQNNNYFEKYGLLEINASNPKLLPAYYGNENNYSNMEDYWSKVKNVIYRFYQGAMLDRKFVYAYDTHRVLTRFYQTVAVFDTSDPNQLKIIDEKDIYNNIIALKVLNKNDIYGLSVDENNNKLVLFRTYFDENDGKLMVKDLKYFDVDASKMGEGAAALGINDKYIFVKTDKHVYKILKKDGSVNEITNLFNDINASQIMDFIDITDKYAFIATFDKIYILDLENGKSTNIDVWHYSKGIRVGNIIYVANFGDSIMVIDVSDPKHPKLLAKSEIQSAFSDIKFENGILYAAGGWAGLLVYDVSNCDTSIDNYSEENNSDTQEGNISAESSGCITASDIKSLPSKQWILMGTGCDITDLSVFNSAYIVWKYDKNDGWKAYSSNQNVINLINNKYPIIKNIKAKEGFWILKK